MKNTLTIVLTFCCALCCTFGLNIQGQITITGADLPAEGVDRFAGRMDNPGIEIGEPSAVGQTWNLGSLVAEEVIAAKFIEVEETDFAAEFPDADFARNASLGTILGIKAEDFLPADLNNAVAYYSTDADGNVNIEGAVVDVSLAGILELGFRTLRADTVYRFWSTGELGDTYNTHAVFNLDINVDDVLPFIPVVPYQGQEATVPFLRVSLGFDTEVEIDAHGFLDQPDGSAPSVLRYNEQNVVAAKLSPFLQFDTGEPFELDVSSLSEEEWDAISDAVGLDISPFLVDTVFNTQNYRFYGNGEGYPLATAIYTQNDVIDGVTSIEFLTEPQILETGFNFSVSETDCNAIVFENTSTGPVKDSFWQFGDGDFSPDDSPTHTYEGNGTYQVILEVEDDFGNVETLEQEVSIDCPAIEASFDANASLGAEDCEDYIFVNTSSAYYFDTGQWLIDDSPVGGFSNENADNELTYTFDESGEHTVQLIIENMTSGETDTASQTITIAEECLWGVGIEALWNGAGVDYELYPNPVQNTIYLNSKTDIPAGSYIEFMDLNGKVLSKQYIADTQRAIQLDVSEFANGMYLFQVNSAEYGVLLLEKIVIE